MSSSVEQIPAEYRRRVVVNDLSRPRRERIASDRAIVADFSASSDGRPVNYSIVDLDALAEKGKPDGHGVAESTDEFAARLADDIVDGVLQLAGFRLERRLSYAGADVIIYKTSWCTFCKKAAEYLRSRNVAFQEKDIEKDAGAAAELAEKLRRNGLSHQGVPVLDIGGRLVLGFDRERIDYLLKEAGR
ncbi:MAG: hypothetical protein D6806_05545 [Deltaproteobacteria bacterium]|nr:MAG: hypothetical protein D6806_05545 [Deltaproteobacteria bacterium]